MGPLDGEMGGAAQTTFLLFILFSSVIECLVYFIYLMPVQDKVLHFFFLVLWQTQPGKTLKFTLHKSFLSSFFCGACYE